MQVADITAIHPPPQNPTLTAPSSITARLEVDVEAQVSVVQTAILDQGMWMICRRRMIFCGRLVTKSTFPSDRSGALIRLGKGVGRSGVNLYYSVGHYCVGIEFGT